jgi:hypothetical protein
LAIRHPEFTDAGGRIVGISIDSPEQNAAMVEKLGLPFPLLSDPDRSQAIVPYGVADPKDDRNIALPTVVLVAPGGEEQARFSARDFADRPPEDDVLAALGSLGLPPAVQPPPEPGAARPGPNAIPLEQLLPYYRGARFAVIAMSRRHPDTKEEADRYVAQLDRYTEAVKQAYRAKRGDTG